MAIVAGGGLLLLLFTGASGSTMGMASDDFASLLYMGLFATLVGSGILASGIRFGQATRSIAAWLAIVLVLVAGYQYRYELQDVGSRLTAGLIPGSPISVTSADGRKSAIIEKAPNGHFETRAQVNGAPVRFVVDTGATMTVLSSEDAARAGYDIGTLTFNVPVSTANGTTRAARVMADEIRVGDIARNRQPIFVAGPGLLTGSLLGMSFMSTLAGYNVRGDRMELID